MKNSRHIARFWHCFCWSLIWKTGMGIKQNWHCSHYPDVWSLEPPRCSRWYSETRVGFLHHFGSTGGRGEGREVGVAWGVKGVVLFSWQTSVDLGRYWTTSFDLRTGIDWGFHTWGRYPRGGTSCPGWAWTRWRTVRPPRSIDRPLAGRARTRRWRSCCRCERGVGSSRGCGVDPAPHGVGVGRNCWRSIGDQERHLGVHDVRPPMRLLRPNGGDVRGVGARWAHFALRL